MFPIINLVVNVNIEICLLVENILKGFFIYGRINVLYCRRTNRLQLNSSISAN